MRKKTLEELKKQMLDINPNIEISGIYINNKTPVACKCIICGHEWTARPDNLIQNWGCPKCRLKKIGDKNRKSQEQVVKDFIKVHGNKYDYSKVNYVKSDKKITIICPIHGEFEQIPDNHLQGHGCPKCNRSKGELLIESFLKNNNIQYICQYPIDVDIEINASGKAKIDFYLPKLNVFIEYSGMQHYVPIEYFGGKLKFEQQQRRDQCIREYSKYNNIQLIEFKFDQSDNEVIQTLKQLL